MGRSQAVRPSGVVPHGAWQGPAPSPRAATAAGPWGHGQAIPWLLFGCAATAFVFGPPDLMIDDGYITLHNARALLAGGADPAYAGSTALTGATSAVHLLAIAGLGLLLPLEAASRLVGLVGLLLYVAGLDRMAVQAGCSRLVLVSLGLLAGYQPLHFVNGLESGLAAAAVAWALVLRDSRGLPVLCGTLPFIRPELALLALPLLARQGWRLRGTPDRVLRTAILAVAAAGPWMALSWAMTGHLVPATGGAKVAFFAQAGLPLGQKLMAALSAVAGSALPVIAFGLVALLRRPAGWCAAVFLLLWLGSATWVLPGGLAHNHGRYLAGAVPVLLFGLAGFFAGGRRLVAAVAILCLLGLQARTVEAAREARRMTQARETMVATLVAGVPATARAAVHDAGYVAWRLPNLRLTDVVGLKTPESVLAFTRHPIRDDDRGPAIAAILAASGAEYFVCLTGDPFWATLATDLARDLARSGRGLEPLDPGGTYTVFRLRPGPATPR